MEKGSGNGSRCGKGKVARGFQAYDPSRVNKDKARLKEGWERRMGRDLRLRVQREYYHFQGY